MKNKIIKPAVLFASVISVAIIVLFACSKSGSNSNNGGGNNNDGGNSVSIANFAFSSSALTVTAGTTVTWTNNDATTHTVTADYNSFTSGNVAPGATFTHVFSIKGTYTYHCTIHPSMTAKVTVN